MTTEMEEEAAAHAKHKKDQNKVLPKGTRVDDDSLFGFGSVQNNLNYMAATVPKQLSLALKIFLGLVVVLLIAWIVFKSVSVNQRNRYLNRN